VAKPITTFITRDHPEANGRRPVFGEFSYAITFPLEDGSTLRVKVGAEGMRHLRNVVLAELCDDETAGGN
jgi:hypothetical protein